MTRDVDSDRDRSLVDYDRGVTLIGGTRGHKVEKRTNTEMTMLSNRIGDYWYISQGKTRIPGVNDGEDMEETDVSPVCPQGALEPRQNSDLLASHKIT